MSFLIRADEEEQIRQSEEYKKYMEEHKEENDLSLIHIYAINLYSKSLALKEEWEQENADIIEAERARSRREELLSADPEALRALGITPVSYTHLDVYKRQEIYT